MPRADDEHFNVPTWRMRQLQDVEHAAREAHEALGRGMRDPEADPARAAVLAYVWTILDEALGDD